MIAKHLSNPLLDRLEDAAVVDTAEKSVFSTDSFVVSPLFFPGGDIGKLAVCGTVNDIAVRGGIPKYISVSLIIEEGMKTEELEKIVQSIAKECTDQNIQAVCGDTKVV
jgi:hydrogenase expression/formation protein HypE